MTIKCIFLNDCMYTLQRILLKDKNSSPVKYNTCFMDEHNILQFEK